MSRTLIAVAALFWLASAQAAGVSVSDAWIRLLPAGLPAAGYFVIENEADRTRRLVGVESPAFGSAMMHRSVTDNGRTAMKHVDSVSVAAGGRLTFAPGGYHVMLMDPSASLAPGGQVPVTLVFADGSRISVDFQLRPASGQAR